MQQTLGEILQQRDPLTYESIITKNCYGVHSPDFQDAYVLDIGANVGIFTYMALMAGAKWVFAVEPKPEIHAQLSKDMAGRVATVLPVAAFSTTGTGYISRGHNMDSAFLSKTGESVPMVTLDALMSFIPFGAKVVVKVDVEGSEYDVLYGASRATLDRITTLCVEIHDTGTESLADYIPHVKKHSLHTEASLLQYLLKMGFHSVWALNFFEIQNGQTLPSPVNIRKLVH